MDGEREIRRVCFLNLDQQRNKKGSQDILKKDKNYIRALMRYN